MSPLALLRPELEPPRPASLKCLRDQPAQLSPAQPSSPSKPGNLFYFILFFLAQARFCLVTDAGVRVPEVLDKPLRSRRLRFCYTSVFPQPLCRPSVSGLTVSGHLVFSCSSSFNLLSSSFSAPPYFLFSFFLLPAASSRHRFSSPLSDTHLTDSRVLLQLSRLLFPFLILHAGQPAFLPAVTFSTTL